MGQARGVGRPAAARGGRQGYADRHTRCSGQALRDVSVSEISAEMLRWMEMQMALLEIATEKWRDSNDERWRVAGALTHAMLWQMVDLIGPAPSLRHRWPDNSA